MSLRRRTTEFRNNQGRLAEFLLRQGIYNFGRQLGILQHDRLQISTQRSFDCSDIFWIDLEI